MLQIQLHVLKTRLRLNYQLQHTTLKRTWIFAGRDGLEALGYAHKPVLPCVPKTVFLSAVICAGKYHSARNKIKLLATTNWTSSAPKTDDFLW